jgi:hypothetical protein
MLDFQNFSNSKRRRFLRICSVTLSDLRCILVEKLFFANGE